MSEILLKALVLDLHKQLQSKGANTNTFLLSTIPFSSTNLCTPYTNKTPGSYLGI